ncbi:hypothetical protein RB653_005235 [Dictyostelium firmibasis]|uniref:Uncharacterized protein n=1 Tax=Dictyostelium firmibasis TaxID=79012 RepID=A0AAN7U6T1_9MYCE
MFESKNMYRLYKIVFNNIFLSNHIFKFVRYENINHNNRVNSMDYFYKTYEIKRELKRSYEFSINELLSKKLYKLFNDLLDHYFKVVQYNKEKHWRFLQSFQLKTREDLISLLTYKKIGFERFLKIYNHFESTFNNNKEIVLLNAAKGGNFKIYQFLFNKTQFNNKNYFKIKDNNGDLKNYYQFDCYNEKRNELENIDCGGNNEIFKIHFDRFYKDDFVIDFNESTRAFILALKIKNFTLLKYLIEYYFQVKTNPKAYMICDTLFTLSLIFSSFELAKIIIENEELKSWYSGNVDLSKNDLIYINGDNSKWFKIKQNRFIKMTFDFDVFIYYLEKGGPIFRVCKIGENLKFINMNHDKFIKYKNLAQSVFNNRYSLGYIPTFNQLKNILLSDRYYPREYLGKIVKHIVQTNDVKYLINLFSRAEFLEYRFYNIQILKIFSLFIEYNNNYFKHHKNSFINGMKSLRLDDIDSIDFILEKLKSFKDKFVLKNLETNLFQESINKPNYLFFNYLLERNPKLLEDKDDYRSLFKIGPSGFNGYQIFKKLCDDPFSVFGWYKLYNTNIKFQRRILKRSFIRNNPIINHYLIDTLNFETTKIYDFNDLYLFQIYLEKLKFSNNNNQRKLFIERFYRNSNTKHTILNYLVLDSEHYRPSKLNSNSALLNYLLNNNQLTKVCFLIENDIDWFIKNNHCFMAIIRYSCKRKDLIFINFILQNSNYNQSFKIKLILNFIFNLIIDLNNIKNNNFNLNDNLFKLFNDINNISFNLSPLNLLNNEINELIIKIKKSNRIEIFNSVLKSPIILKIKNNSILNLLSILNFNFNFNYNNNNNSNNNSNIIDHNNKTIIF